MNRVIHFEILADDPERAIRFYSGLFKWKVSKTEMPEPYWLVHTGHGTGIHGAIMKRTVPLTGPGIKAFLCTIQVKNIDDIIGRIQGAGGKIVEPKAAIPRVGYFAYCEDTEGNMFGILQSDRRAGR